MNIFERALRAINPQGFKLGYTQQSTPWQSNHPGPNFPGWRWDVGDRDYRNSVAQAKLSSLVAIAIGYRADNAVSTPWLLMRRDGSETLTEHAVLDMLNFPNPYDDGRSVCAKVWRDLDLRGNAYALKVNSVMGNMVEAWQRSSLMLKPIVDKAGMLIKYQYKVSNEPAVYYDPEDVIHLRYPDPDGAPWDGLSPLEAAAIELFLDREAGRKQADTIKNGLAGMLLALAAMPEDERPTSEELAAIREYLKNEMSGSSSGDMHMVDFPVVPHKITFSPEELKLLETHNYAEERIAGIYKLPAAILQLRSGLENTTANATLREWERQAWHASIIPTQDLIAEQLSQQLLPEFMGENWRQWVLGYDRSKIVVLQVDDLREGQIWEGRVRSGAFSMAEWRAAVDQPVETEHEIYLVPNGYDRMTLEQLGDTEKQEPPPQFGDGSNLLPFQRRDDDAGNSQETEEEAQEVAERSIRFTRDLVDDLDREERALREPFADDLLRLFNRLGRIAQRAFAQNADRAPTRAAVMANGAGHATRDALTDAALLEAILNTIRSEIEEIADDFIEIGEVHYGRVLRATIGAVDSSLGLVVNMPDPVMEEVVRLGGRRMGLIDLEQQARDSIFKAIADGRALGEGADELGRRIRDMVGAGRYTKAGAPYRARMIARTETKYAQGISSYRTYEAAGITHVRLVDDQLGYGDEECSARNGQVIPLEDFPAVLAEEHPNGTLRGVPMLREQVNG